MDRASATMRTPTLLLLALMLAGCGGSSGGAAITSNPTPPSTATPTLVQHVHTSTNSENNPGNNFKIPLPNPALSGNCLILGLTFPNASGRTITITDNHGGNTWTAGPTANTGMSGVTTAIYYALNVAAGTQVVTVTFDALIPNFSAVVSEFYNVATSGAVDGSSTSTTSSGPTVMATSLTTGTAGDLIYNFASDTNLITPGVYSPGSGFSLLSVDNTLTGNVAQYSIQTAAGSVSPSFSFTGSHDLYTTVAFALKAASAGTAPPAGIRVVHVLHTLADNGNTQTVQFPSSGNLILLTTTFAPDSGGTINTVTDSNGASYARVVGPNLPNDSGQIFYAASATPGNNLSLTMNDSSGFMQVVLMDVTGAAASPFDVKNDASVLNSTNAPMQNIPTITPTTPNGLIVCVGPIGTGPVTGASGTNNNFLSVVYTGEIDNSAMDAADGYAIIYNPTATQQSFTWTVDTPSVSLPTEFQALAVAFKAASQ